MALYEPTQRLDFLYISDHNAIYVRATVTVLLNINENIPTPPPDDIDKDNNEISITLRAMNPPGEDGRYSQTIPILVKVIDTNFDGIPSEDEVAAEIGENEYTVTTTVFKDGTPKGKVTTISQNEDIEIL
jgi:hypothetical protein